MNCRHCAKPLIHTFLDLGFAPPSNAYLNADDLISPEKYYPLKVKVCNSCWLVQTEDYAAADELFNSEYAYFSSTSSSWLDHAAQYAKTMISKFSLSKNSYVIEIASNDGYLLKNFVDVNIPCLGIEPTASTAAAAASLGIPVLKEFFSEALGQCLAKAGKRADLIIGNNVYAHVPEINDFTLGIKAALKPEGIVTLEFPHLMQLVDKSQFDTIYHEHFSYLSLYTVCQIFQSVGLRVWHVEKLNTHGGSLRIFGCHDNSIRLTTLSVVKLLEEEEDRGLQRLSTYLDFQIQANKIKDNLLTFLIEQKRLGKRVMAYGAAAKGNTLINYAGIKKDLLALVFDAAQAKQNKFLPGSHIPILPPSAIRIEKPDFLIILPWNIADEIQKKYAFVNEWNCKFIIAVPTLHQLQ